MRILILLGIVVSLFLFGCGGETDDVLDVPDIGVPDEPEVVEEEIVEEETETEEETEEEEVEEESEVEPEEEATVELTQEDLDQLKEDIDNLDFDDLGGLSE